MGVNEVTNIITTVGFPIFCVLALGFAMWKAYGTITERNKEREDKYIEMLKEQTSINEKFTTVLSEISTKMTSLCSDVDDLKNEVETIKKGV